MTESAKDGQLSAHTQAAAGADAPSSAMPGADPAALIEGSPDLDAQDVLALAAEFSAAPRRARGRPAGAANRKNADMIAYLQALGHRDPWMTLSMIHSADTMQLAKMLGSPIRVDGKVMMVPVLDADRKPLRDDNGELLLTPAIEPADPLKVLALQEKAAEGLMPYHHAKKPVQLDMLGDDTKRLPVLVAGDLNIAQIAQVNAMSLGLPLREVLQNQQVIEDAPVRQTDASHEDDVST